MMKIKKISPGVEELHMPIYLLFQEGAVVEVPDDIGQALVKKLDFVEVKEIDKSEKKERKRKWK